MCNVPFVKFCSEMVSKGYVLIGEQLDGSVTELESRDLNFFESEFPNKGEVEKNLTLYEMMDQEGGAPSRLVEDKEDDGELKIE